MKKNILYFEFSRIWSKKKTYIILIVLCVFSILESVIYYLSVSNRGSISDCIPAYQLFQLYTDGIFTGMYLCFFAPMISILVSSNVYLKDYNDLRLPIIISRTSRRIYLAQGISAFVNTFIVIIIPFIVNQIACLMLAPTKSFSSYIRGLSPFGQGKSNDVLLHYITFDINPYLSNIFVMIIVSIYFSTISLMAYTISIYIKKVQRNQTIMIGIGLSVSLFTVFINSFINGLSPLSYLSALRCNAMHSSLILYIEIILVSTLCIKLLFKKSKNVKVDLI